MRLGIVDTNRARHPEFNKPLVNFVSSVSPQVEVKQVHHANSAELQALINDEETGGLIGTGVRLDYPYRIARERRPLSRVLISAALERDIPYLGICVMHQAAALEAGTGLRRDREPERGEIDVEIVTDDRILEGFGGVGSTFTARTQHRASVQLPDSYSRLARTDTCDNQMMRLNNPDGGVNPFIYTVQFHPELPGEAQRILTNFVDLVLDSQSSASQPAYT